MSPSEAMSICNIQHCEFCREYMAQAIRENRNVIVNENCIIGIIDPAN
jgi:hypothetical protein